VQHAQLYTEPERLARAGLVTEQRESEGRRRKRYKLTPAGREALAQWRAEPTAAFTELRDPGLLQLFFGADPKALAAKQLAVHRERLDSYLQLRDAAADAAPDGPGLALESGIGHEREWVQFWSKLAGGS
jgi:DNA-binding PadR family transcriptional regulator